MSIEDDIAILLRVPMLALLGREALRILAIGAETHAVDEGETLFREGEPADAGFVIQEGTFELTSAKNSAKLARMGVGCLLGELALLTRTTRPATAKAVEPSSVVRIPRQLFLKMLDAYPDAARQLRRAMRARAERSIEELDRVKRALENGAPSN
jgi:CRP-like cAMP-binding protein